MRLYSRDELWIRYRVFNTCSIFVNYVVCRNHGFRAAAHRDYRLPLVILRYVGADASTVFYLHTKCPACLRATVVNFERWRDNNFHGAIVILQANAVMDID